MAPFGTPVCRCTPTLLTVLHRTPPCEHLFPWYDSGLEEGSHPLWQASPVWVRTRYILSSRCTKENKLKLLGKLFKILLKWLQDNICLFLSVSLSNRCILTSPQVSEVPLVSGFLCNWFCSSNMGVRQCLHWPTVSGHV